MNLPPSPPQPSPQPYPPSASPAATDEPRRVDSSDVRVALLAVGVLAVVGALAGLVWSAWSPPGPAAEVLGGGTFAVIDEQSESAIAGDGRFLVIVAAIGVVAAVLAWVMLRADRGATMLFGLCVGAGVGGLLTELVGHLSGGGSFHGALYRLTDGSTREITLHLPLSVHLQALLFVEPVVVALVYGVLVAFAQRDDLGRPDPVRDALMTSKARSVDAGDHPQYGGGHGDAAGVEQQREFPPQ